ncbi:MAG TPA: folylpolyglutamate synthase/dihydrofolate synthase family protein [Pseudomonadales bacterium]|nr:folylpolyglutamate synthase/dihydrofolate synthase family protein [Pseudomonadales bacterium]
MGRYSTVDAWLRWQETLHPSVIDLGLVRLREVAARLFGDQFETQQPLTITVAGTNGKGSCVKTLSVLLRAMGKRVGAFTSPHLLRYNERICIDNNDVSDADLCDAFSAIDAARADTSLTYFEFNALAALWLFRKYRVEVQVLEVGLGGRLDAVNMINADIAVITNIALDHVDWLGDTREKIGAEKAGILREHGKLVYGEADMPESICDRIAELDVTFRQIGEEFGFVRQAGDQWLWQGMDAEGDALQLRASKPALPEPSVACALQVLAWLDLFDAEKIAAALPSLSLAGRFEQRSYRGKLFILDVAHNAAGATFLAARLQQENIRPVLLFSAMADKDIAAVLQALRPFVSRGVFFPLKDNPRAATPAQLQEAAQSAGFSSADFCVCDDFGDALASAVSAGTVLVCGSFFTVATAREYLHADS